MAAFTLAIRLWFLHYITPINVHFCSFIRPEMFNLLWKVREQKQAFACVCCGEIGRGSACHIKAIPKSGHAEVCLQTRFRKKSFTHSLPAWQDCTATPRQPSQKRPLGGCSSFKGLLIYSFIYINIRWSQGPVHHFIYIFSALMKTPMSLLNTDSKKISRLVLL